MSCLQDRSLDQPQQVDALQIPNSLLGLYRDVNQGCQRLVTAIGKRGVEAWDEFAADGLREVPAAGCALVLNGPSSSLGASPHAHVYLPLLRIEEAMLKGKLPDDADAGLFDRVLASDWGTLSLMGRANQT